MLGVFDEPFIHSFDLLRFFFCCGWAIMPRIFGKRGITYFIRMRGFVYIIILDSGEADC